jgi:transcriptional regulator with XRE-family HTH domain
MNTSKLEKLIHESKLSKTEICSKCGFTRPTLDNVLSGSDIKISTIVSLAEFFKVSIGYFFDEENSENNELSNKLEECKKEIRRLNTIIDEGKGQSYVLVAVPINSDSGEYIDLRDTKDISLKILRK